MYLLTKSETLNSNTSATLSGVTDGDAVIDGKLNTFVETPTLAPTLTIDLGERKVIDALYLKGENLQDYTLAASDDNTNFTSLGTTQTMPSHGHAFQTFANTTPYRYWRITFSARGASDPNYRVAEVFLMPSTLGS